MPAPTNTITTEQMIAGLDREMVRNFEQENSRLMELLGLVSVEVLPANTTLVQYKVTGALSTEDRAEGEEVPLSQYKLEKVAFDTFTPKPYRKVTTAESILKSGYVNAVINTDDKMVKQVRADRLSDFFTGLAKGTGTATGTTLQAVLAQVDAKLEDTLEANGDSADRIIHFVNRFDIADYLSTANVTTQTAYGMTYIQSFLGVNDIFVTSKVAKGTVWATPNDNIHIYSTDFSELSNGGLTYTTSDSGLIGVSHNAKYDHVSAETNVLSGMMMLPEMLDYIVKGTIAPAA